MNSEVEVVPVGDKKVTNHAAQPKLEYTPSASEFRVTQQQMATTLKESSTFLFHDSKLPDGKEMLGILKEASKEMGNQPVGTGLLSDGSHLSLRKDKGHVTEAELVRPDGSVDSAKFDDKLRVTSETVSTAFGTTARDYRADGSLSVEENTVAGDSAGAGYRDKLEFDRKGKLFHSHIDTAAGSQDDVRQLDGSGRRVTVVKDADPKKAYVDTLITKQDGSIVDDINFGNGDFKHRETDARGLVKSEESDVEKGVVNRLQRQPDGEMAQFRDLLI
jgi:hypothetical protein